MSIDLLGLAALGGVAVEWLALGWLSGLRIGATACTSFWVVAAATWSVRLLVGAFLVALAQLLLATAGAGFGFIPGVLLVAAVGAIAVRQALRTASRPKSDEIEEPCDGADLSSRRRRELLGWLVLGGLVLGALVRSLIFPESGWDAYSHWGLRAQAFATAGTLVDAHSEHEYYPPLVPLLEAWLYLHRGVVSIDLAKTLWALVGGAFAIALGWHLRLGLSRGAVWLAPYLATGIVLLTPELLDGFWTGQADLPLTAYLCLATLAVWQWQRDADRRWLVQAAVFAGAAALTKFEGLPRIGLVCVAVLIEAAFTLRPVRAQPRRGWRRSVAAVLSLLVPATAVWLLWTVFQLAHAIPANAEHLGAFQPLALGGIVVALFGVFGGVRTGGGLVVTLAAWVVAAPALLRPPLRLLVLVVGLQALGTLFAFFVSATSPELQVLTSATRLVEQFLPIALMAGALGLARIGQPIIGAGDEDSARRENHGSRRA